MDRRTNQNSAIDKPYLKSFLRKIWWFLKDLSISYHRYLNRPWFPRHSPSSGNSVSHTLLETAA
ncbi:hypothetical protein QVM55_13840, partial [Pseudomonas monteilii]|uniref:hypothetical protein n=1 Tax=Pseudomonas monteilii TaxID=76759 RepID=UPI0035265D77